MARKNASDPIIHEMQQELLRTNQALKDAYTRFDCVCDTDLIDACIYEINALKARSGEDVPSGVPHAVPVRAEDAAVAAAAIKEGDVCPS